MFQLDNETNYLAAFTSIDPSDKVAFFQKYTKLLTDPLVNNQTITLKNIVAGSIAKFEVESVAEITYWVGKKFWGKGVATSALKSF